MIRTHKPRGFAWACASAFQQTPQIRDVSYQDSEAAYAKDDILCDDAEDEFSIAERSAKRRRIEKFADEFLNGNIPHIHAARPSLQATEDAICQLHDLPKVARHAFQRGCAEMTDDDIWEDELDDGEVLRAFIASRQPDTNDQAGVMLEAFEPQQEDIVTDVQAQASCGPKRHLRSTRVSIGPSEDALRKAAELRNRRSRRSVLATQTESQPQSCRRPVIAESQTQSLDSASDCGPSPTPAWTSSKWLRSGAFKLRRKVVDEDCSRDELGASSLLAPSQRSQLPSRQLTGAHAASSFPAPTASTVPATSFKSVPSQDHVRQKYVGPQALENAQNDYTASETSAEAAYKTAPNAAATSAGSQSQDGDSQTQLLRRQGIRAEPLKSWATVNDPLDQPQSAEIAELAPVDDTFVSPAIKTSIRQSAATTAGTAKRGRKANSASNTPANVTRKTSNRRRTAPSKSQNLDNEMAKLPEDQRRRIGAFRTQYSSVQVNGASPFFFRKRASKFNNSDEPDVEPIPVQNQPPAKTPRRRAELPSSDAPQISKQALAGTTTVEAHPAGPQPITSLVTEHLNRILPKDKSPGRRSSSVRKALREELLASGAEISRCEGDSSSQAEQHMIIQASPSGNGETDFDNTENEIASLSGAVIESQPKVPWIGTQQLLAQAQADLFTSPDKSESALYLGDKTTPQAQAGIPRVQLRQLSQDRQLPSTQALLDGFQGWSSIKKRPDGKHTGLGQSPSVGKGMTKMIASDPIQSPEPNNRRRISCLRYSLSFPDSPIPAPIPASTNKSIVRDSFLAEMDSTTADDSFLTLAPPRAQSSGLPDLENTADDSFLKPAPPRAKSSGKFASSLSFGFSSINVPGQSGFADDSQGEDPSENVDTMTSYQNAQRYSLDSQHLNLTFTELAEDVLDSAKRDLGGVMSQSGFGSF